MASETAMAEQMEELQRQHKAEINELASDLADERAARVEAEDAYGRVATDAADQMAELVRTRMQLAAGRAVLTGRIAEWKAEQARWQNLPDVAMDRQDWVEAEHQQQRLGEVEDLLDKFDTAVAAIAADLQP